MQQRNKQFRYKKYRKARLHTKNREKLDYKKLRLSDELYSSEEEQEQKTITPNAFKRRKNNN